MDTGQVDTGRIEEQMRETRARLDRKLDALNARSAAARDQGLWAASVLGGIVGAVLLIRAGRRRLRRRPRAVALPAQHRMRAMNPYIRSAITVVVMMVALVSSLQAQSSGFSAADSKELASYRLTMETTKKMFALAEAMQQEMSADPKFQALKRTKDEIETLSKKEELTDAESARLEKLQQQAEQQEEALNDASSGTNLAAAKNLNEMEAGIKANPRFMAALTRAGLTARDYSKYMLASMMAGMVAGFQKSGMLKEMPKDLKEVNPENVKFMLDHEAELAAMQKAMEK
jgi:hypothetical protein